MLTNYGNLISVAGALLVFFSWLASNTVGERLKRAQTAYSDATATRRLYETLRSLRISIDGIAAGTLYVQQDLARLQLEHDPRRHEEGTKDYYEHNDLIWELASARINARQIEHEDTSCQLAIEQLLQHGDNKGEAAASLLEYCETIKSLKQQTDQLFQEVELLLPTQDNRLFRAKLDHVRGVFRDDILPKFSTTLEEGVEAQTRLSGELAAHLTKAKARASMTWRLSIAFYIVGSIMVLTGTAIDKLSL